MKSVITLIFKYSGILFVLLLLIYWLLFDDPEIKIMGAKLSIVGLLIVISGISIFLVAQKEVLRAASATSISRLVFICAIIGLIAETFFQIVRIISFSDNRIYYYLTGVLGSALMFAVLAFFIAFQLKTHRTGMLVILIISFLLICKAVIYVFPSLIS